MSQIGKGYETFNLDIAGSIPATSSIYKDTMKEKLFTIHKKDFTIQTFRSGGPGGQHQNKTDSGVRIIHKSSDAVGESRNHKSQLQNKKAAMRRLTRSGKFKLWLNTMVFEITSGKTIDQRVDESMVPANIKIETHDDKGRWIESNLEEKHDKI